MLRTYTTTSKEATIYRISKTKEKWRIYCNLGYNGLFMTVKKKGELKNYDTHWGYEVNTHHTHTHTLLWTHLPNNLVIIISYRNETFLWFFWLSPPIFHWPQETSFPSITTISSPLLFFISFSQHLMVFDIMYLLPFLFWVNDFTVRLLWWQKYQESWN